MKRMYVFSKLLAMLTALTMLLILGTAALRADIMKAQTPEEMHELLAQYLAALCADEPKEGFPTS